LYLQKKSAVAHKKPWHFFSLLAMDALQKLDDGTLVLETPPDLKSGATRIVQD
jgi:hypothetical protein